MPIKANVKSPYEVDWPPIKAEVSGAVLDALCAQLKPIGEEYERKSKQSTKKVAAADVEANVAGNNRASTDLASKHIIIGLNSVTAQLEYQVRQHLAKDPHLHNLVRGQGKRNQYPPPMAGKALAYVFVCRQDLHEQLIEHLPVLCAMLQSSVKLVGFERGAQFRLSKILRMHRVGVLGVLDDPSIRPLGDVVGRVDLPTLKWTVPFIAPDSTNMYIQVDTEKQQSQQVAPPTGKRARRREEKAANTKKKKKSS